MGAVRAGRVLGACALLVAFVPAEARAQTETAAPLADPSSSSASPRAPTASAALAEMSLEDLMSLETVSVAKKPLKLLHAPAAIHVVTEEDVRRLGIRSIPEAMRLSPGATVARVDSSTWAVGVRGFNDALNRKMLVLIDGRSVYSPLFAGVFWDAQDVFLPDMERIEVIRGPGGALWGANAVNGVVNVLTKEAKDTQGALAFGGAGSEELGFAGFRYGDKVGEDLHWRVYGQVHSRDSFRHPDGPDYDDWQTGQTGFRADWDASERDHLTVSGDFYDGLVGRSTQVSSFTPPFSETVVSDDRIIGGDVLARYRRDLGEASDVTLRTYYDTTYRRTPTFREARDTFDSEVRWRFPLPLRQDVILGAGYRVSSGDTRSVPTIDFIPDDRTEDVANLLVQDEITLVEDALKLTLGARFEHNDYTGFEWHPSARIALTPVADHTIWAAVSRAVRTPSRIEQDFEASFALDPAGTTFGRLVGDDGFDSEVLVSYEAGYRALLTRRIALDVSGYYNRYDDLLSVEPGTPFAETDPPPGRTVAPLFLRNRIHGRAYGGEVSLGVDVTEWWRAQGAYSLLLLDLGQDAGGRDQATEAAVEGQSPKNQAYLRSSWELPREVFLDAIGRYVDHLRAQGIRSYVTADARIAWRPRKGLEVALVGQNLVDTHHAEFDPGSEVERGAYLSVEWRF